jgi:fatty-acyl-CoA synthase
MKPGRHLPATFDPLRFWSSVAPDRAALIDRDTGRRWSYRELDREASRWSAMLRRQGIRRGSRIATLSGNRAELIHLFFACGRVGCALVPLNWRLAAAELRSVMSDAAPSLVLTEARFQNLLRDAIGEVAEAGGEATGSGLTPAPAGGSTPDRSRPIWIDLDRQIPGMLGEMDREPDAVVAPDDPWLILYTSGSTGAPKGAMLPFRQIFHNAVSTGVAWELTSADVGPISTPLFHTGGWNVLATPLWYRGGTVVLFQGFEPAAFLDGLREQGCTIALTVPTQLLMLAEASSWGVPIPSLRHFVSGGAPCPEALKERVRLGGYRLREGFGLTECGPNCFATSEAITDRSAGSVGIPVPFLEMQIVDEEDASVADGEVGELLLRGPQLFSGYLNRPEQTAEAFAPDGWLRTGDLARRDREGRFWICGRRKEMFISGGENVFPGEIEAALFDLNGVQEAVVVGVPDPRWGEVGRAFVVPKPGASLTEPAVLSHLRSRLAGYKAPRHVTILPEMPRLGSGKPDRRALRHLPLDDGAIGDLSPSLPRPYPAP